MPQSGHVAAARQTIREQRGKLAVFGAILWRRKMLILTCVGLVLGLTAGYLSAFDPVYEARALVAVGDRAGQQVGQSAAIHNAAPEDQLGLIESRAMAERLIDRLDLHFLPEFRPEWRALRLAEEVGQWLPDALVDRLPKAWEGKLGRRPSDGAMTDEQRAALLWEEVIAAAMARIHAEVTAPSVIALKFRSENPRLAAAGATALAELYLEELGARRQNASKDDRARLEQEIERLRASIRETEQVIAAARAGADAQARASAEQSRLDLTGELAFWRRERAELEARLRQTEAALQSGAGLDPAALHVRSDRLAELQANASELEQALVTLSQQRGEQHPQILELRAQLAALEQERRAEVEQALEPLRDELAIIQSREVTLESQIAALEEPSAPDQAAPGLAVLEQRLAADRALLREHIEQAAGQLGGEVSATAPPDARVIAPAGVPDQPTYPRLAIWGVASAGALLLGISLAFALEALQRARA